MAASTNRNSKAFLVECYWPGVSEELVTATAARALTAAAEMSREGRSVRYVHWTLIPSDEAVLAVVHAASATDVEEASRRAKVPFDRILPARAVTNRKMRSRP